MFKKSTVFTITFLMLFSLQVFGLNSQGSILKAADLTTPQLRQETYAVSQLNRYYGVDCFETAVAISRTGWETSETVILARGDDYADALTGVPLAYKLNAPILLTRTKSLPEVDIVEIQRLQARKVIILGGSVAIAETVANKLRELGLSVERIGGIDKYDTAAKIAEQVVSADVSTAVIVNGDNFYDALAVSSYAAVKGYPMLMVKTDTIPPTTAEVMERLKISNTYVIGRAEDIGETVYGQLQAPLRVGGGDRYATAVELAKYFAVAPRELFIATGLNFPDSIAGAVLAAKHNTGILYVPGTLQAEPYVDADVAKFIINNKIQTINILGGTGVINDATVTSLRYPSKGAYEVRTMPNVRTEMLKADYWISKIADPDRIILNPDQIKNFNQEIVRQIPNLMYNLADYPRSFTRETLIGYIDQPFPTDPSYMGAEIVDEAYWQNLKMQMNVEGLVEKSPVKYGLTVRRSNLKIFPTANVIGDEPNDPAFDLFQNSAILPAEPMVILHKSLDEKWYYVHMYNCPGWLPVEDVAVCDRETWLDYQNEPDFVVVTGNRIKLDNDPLLPQISEMELTMGTRVPLVKLEEQPETIRNRRIYQSYVVKLPVRTMSGDVEFTMASIPIFNDVTVGYLPYTRANILRQAFKMQGERYFWGGMLNGRDCSSLVMELNSCFGFKLARNSEAQAVSAGKTVTFNSDHSIADREKLLKSLSQGASLYFPGHEMLYLGEDNGYYYVLNDLGAFVEFKPGETESNFVRVRTVVINELNIKRGSGKRWIEVLTTAKLLE